MTSQEAREPHAAERIADAMMKRLQKTRVVGAILLVEFDEGEQYEQVEYTIGSGYWLEGAVNRLQRKVEELLDEQEAPGNVGVDEEEEDGEE